MTPSLEETIYVDFITSAPTTGAASDADSLPTCEVFEDATDTAIVTPTVVKRTGKTGDYRAPIACTAANGFETGKSYNVVVTATVGGVVAKAVVKTFQVRAAVWLSASDLNSIADAVLKRDFSALTGEAAFSLLNAARALRSKWSTAGSVLTVYKEDGTSTAWTSTLITNPAADPITGGS